MPGFPCCCTGCDIASDEFDRASVGSGWTQVSGSWSISSDRLETSDSDALVIFATDHPEGSSSHHISVLGQVSDTESKIRGIVAYDSADDYIFAELMINASDCSEIKFFERVGGSTSQIGDTRKIGLLAAGTDYRLEVCFQDDTYPNDDGEMCVKLSLSDDSRSWTFCESSITATGDQVGLGTGTLTSSGSASFESFEWNISKKDQGSCPDCKGSTCLLLSDTFTRADSTDLGCNWTETSGSWEIDDNELVTSSASAQVTTTMTNFRPGYDIIEGTFRFGTGVSDTAATGDVARMMLDVDGSDSHALQVTCGAESGAPYGKVELLKGSTILAAGDHVGVDPGRVLSFSVCLQDGYIEATVVASGGASVHLDSGTTPYGGKNAALGTGSGNSSIVTFDSFSWYRAKSSDDMSCPDCIDVDPTGCPNCINEMAPDKLKVVISGFSAGNWPCDINGTYILSIGGDGGGETILDPDGNPHSGGEYGCCYSQIETIKLYPPDPDADPPHNGNSCTFYSLVVCIVHDEGGYAIRGTLGIDYEYEQNPYFCPCTTDSTYWFRRFHTKIDCLNLSGMSIPFDGTHLTSPHRFVRHCDNEDYAECNFSGAALVVTSL
jgi:hypothetical protein